MIRRFAALPFREQWLLVEAVTVLAVVRGGIAVGSFASVQRVLSGLSTVFPGRLTPTCGRDRVRWAVSVAAAVLPGTSKCLVRALTAELLLVRRGYEASLCIGVEGTGSGIRAHAWIESDGDVVVGGGDLSEFTTLGHLDPE